ncbi:MAG: TonB-dependent receptor plug domain-containing protein [Bacteroidetes bacterium]|nr:TonB-dependent receptor plug domain-containing protein [Bacteroidota bacterium]
MHTNTDANGTLTFNADAQDIVTISVKGYKKTVVAIQNLVKDGNVKLEKTKPQMGDDDVVLLPFNTLKKRNLTNGTTVVSGDKLSSYPTSDIRNAFTGLATGIDVVERSGAPGVHAQEMSGRFSVTDKISVYSRGMTVDYMVDGIPVEITQIPLDPEEIESVTFIKDIVAKAMFGPTAADGVIYITTKRGVKNERTLTVDIENGLKSVDRFPEWVDGADYARLTNLALTNSGLPARYTDADIAAYAKNDPYDLYHPSVDFRKLMLKDNFAFRRVNVSSNGGNNAVQYHSYLGYNSEGDIYKIGPTADYNRINTRSNIDIRVNDFIKVKFDFIGGLTFPPVGQLWLRQRLLQ